MDLPKFKVVQGIIYVNSINVEHCSEDALVFAIDTKQKYPKFYLDGTGHAFDIGADEDTLYVDDSSADLTEVMFEGWGEGELDPAEYWTFTSGSRYGVRIAIVKVKTIAQFVDTDQFVDGSL